MKANKTLIAAGFSLLLNFALVSGFAITPKDLATSVNSISLDARGKPGGSSKGGSSGSGSKSSKKSSKLKKGASRADADSELSSWGMQRTQQDESEYPPKPFNFNDESNALYDHVAQSSWQGNTIAPDASHQAAYGAGPIYTYQTNMQAGAFHTDGVFTTEVPMTHQPRDLPTNRRTLTYNAWIEAGGDPQNLQIFSDENIVNPAGRKAFEDTLRAKGFDPAVPDQWVQVNRDEPAWSKWDNGQNPFPDGYETMTIDYSTMQSTLLYVNLFVDESGDYHTVHVMQHVPDLAARLDARSVYFMRRNMTDPWMI